MDPNRPAYRTTEFWLALLVAVCNAVLPQLQAAVPAAGLPAIAQEVGKILLGLAATYLVKVHHDNRTEIKKTAMTLEQADKDLKDLVQP